MVIRYIKGPSNVIFDISGDNIKLSHVSRDHSTSLVYNFPADSAVIFGELEWTARHHPGMFRLLWMNVAPWADISEEFVRLAQKYDITL